MSDVKDALNDLFLNHSFVLSKRIQDQRDFFSIEETKNWAEIVFGEKLIIHQLELFDE